MKEQEFGGSRRHAVCVGMTSAAALCGLAALAPEIAIADDVFRCGQWLITSEVTTAELLKKCGEPTSRKVSTELIHARTTGGATQTLGVAITETWRYDRGTRAAAMVVTIVDGEIQSIEREK